MPPVQILGGLEASGQIFDYCWFVGMSEKNWPSSLKKNTLIPKSIQVVNSIISSDPILQLEYSKKLTQNYIKSSKNIIVSLSASRDEHSPRISNIFINCIKDLGLEFITAPR